MAVWQCHVSQYTLGSRRSRGLCLLTQQLLGAKTAFAVNSHALESRSVIKGSRLKGRIPKRESRSQEREQVPRGVTQGWAAARAEITATQVSLKAC